MKSRSLITSSFSGTTSSSMSSLKALGIWTSGTDNQLNSDSSTLDSALADNFDDVKNLLRNYGNTTTNKGEGIMRQFYDYMSEVTDTTSGAITLRESSIENSISSNQSRLTKKKSDLSDYETALYAHYAVMETMVANYNSQGSYISSLSSSSSSSSK